jgi:hypothetical protein
MMKFAWRNDIGNLAAWNSSQIEDIEDEDGQYKDMLIADEDLNEWDKMGDEVHIE